MATKRIKDITNTGSEDDLKSENFLALDGPNGSKKIPGDAFTPSGRTASISSSIAPEFDPDRAETYPAGSLVMHEGELREFTADHPTGPWISGDNKAANVAALIKKSIPLYESIFQYASDWKIINSDWVLGPDCTCKVKVVGGTPQTVSLGEAFNFLLSKELKILYVQSKLVNTNKSVNSIVFNAPISDENWHPLVRYIGSEFETAFMGDANNPVITDYSYPLDVKKGAKLFQYFNTDLNSTPNFGTVGYTGSLNSVGNSGISIKMAIKTDNTSVAFPLDGLTFTVILK